MQPTLKSNTVDCESKAAEKESETRRWKYLPNADLIILFFRELVKFVDLKNLNLLEKHKDHCFLKTFYAKNIFLPNHTKYYINQIMWRAFNFFWKVFFLSLNDSSS